MALEKIYTRIDVEMTGGTQYYAVSAKQGDKATRYVIVNLLNDGIKYTIPTGVKVTANITKPDKTCVYNECTYSGSEVTVELKGQSLAAAGTALCDIEVRTSDESQVISSATFAIEVERSQRNDNAIESSNEFGALQEATKAAMKATQDANTAAAKALEAEKKTTDAIADAKSATEQAKTAAKACENIADGMNTMIDTVTKKVCKMSIEDGIIVLREV